MKNFIITIGIMAMFKISYAQVDTISNISNEPQQAINICALAIPLLNMYVVNYEYLHHNRHGFAARVEYTPKLKGENTNGVEWACVLNYRWHFSPKLKNFFIGPYIRYRYIYGSGKVDTKNYDYDVTELNIGINGGYRWVSKSGINIVLSAGYGYSIIDENLSTSNKDVNLVFSKFKKTNDTNEGLFDAPFYGEVSFGYAF